MRRRIKRLQAEKDLSIKNIVTNALDMYLRTEEESIGRKLPVLRGTSENRFAGAILYELEKFLSPEAARVVLEENCRRHNIDIRSVSASQLTQGIIADICRSIEQIESGVEAGKAKMRLLALAGGETK